MPETSWDSMEEVVSTAGGSFYGWDTKPGQKIVGEVLSFSATNGTTYDGDPCPQLSLLLTEPTTSYASKEGTSQEMPVDSIVTINCSQSTLKRGIMELGTDRPNGPMVGDLLGITFSRIHKTQSGHPAKIFEFRISKNKDVAAGVPAATDAPF